MAYRPDFSSSEDEFDDPEFKELVRQQRLDRIQNFDGSFNEKQQKEQKIKKIQNDIIYRNNEEVLKVINNEIDLNEKLEDEWTPISLAASVGNLDLVEKLYELGADISLKKGSDTIIMCACNCPESKATFEESSKVVQFLIDKGADVNAKNRKRMNALMFAASNGNLNAVELLLPLVDLNEEDNQNWDALFWGVHSGNATLVQFFIDKGLATNRTDLRGNLPLDIAVDSNFKDIVNLLMPEEEDQEDFLVDNHENFEEIFKDLKKLEKPTFIQDVCNFLHGTRCENLVKLFANKNVKLLDLLSCSEDEFKELGVAMPFQRRRLVSGIHRFHKQPFQPTSIPIVAKDEFYSNVDIAAAVLSAVKQFICMEASLKYIIKNGDNMSCLNDKEVIEQALSRIQSNLRRLKKIVERLENRAAKWDKQIEPVNVITSKSGRRWFPWRKAVFVFGFGIAVVLSVKLWRRPFFSIV